MNNQSDVKGTDIEDRTLEVIASDVLDVVFSTPELLGKASAWWTHVPFAFWIMSVCRPRTFVELGTHHGVSYAAFCEANARERIGARCFAVDTWTGDEHAGFYDDSIFWILKEFNEHRYRSFSTLIRATFHEAVDHFEDASIDLLHIDGRHRYEDVKADYDEWLPKLSDRAVVLFHDTNVRELDFGVHRFFHEIAARHPTFEFLHGFGLGVVALGANAPSEVKNLCALKIGLRTARITDRFAQLGSLWNITTREALSRSELITKHAEAESRFASQAQAFSTEKAEAEARLASQAQAFSTEKAEAEARLASQAQAFSTKKAEAEARLASQAQAFSTEKAEAEARLASQAQAFSTEKAEAEARLASQAQAFSTEKAEAEARLASQAQAFSTEKAEAEARLASQAQAFFVEQAEAEARFANHTQVLSIKQVKTQILFDRSLRRIVDMRRSIESLGWELSDVLSASNRKIRGIVDYFTLTIYEFEKRYAAVIDAEASTCYNDELIDQIRRSIYFDADWYRSMYKDVADTNSDPATHYLLYGAAEGREPGPIFSGRQYLDNNPDVAASGINPLLHYSLHARNEGRSFRAPLTLERPTVYRRSRALGKADTSLLYISGEPDTPGHRYRVLRYIEAATANGLKADFIRHDRLQDERAKLETCGTLIIWRVPWDEKLEEAIDLIKARGGTIVFDVDDLMVDPSLARVEVIDGIRTQSLTEDQARSHYDRVRRTMLAADFCITTTQELAFHIRRVGKTTFVLPNGFDEATLERSRTAARDWDGRKDGLVRIGYAGGSRTHQRDLGLAIEAIGKVLRENATCRLVLFRTADGTPLIDVDEYAALQPVLDQIEWRLLQPLEALPNEMARFDINLAPLEFGNPFCEAKSELKFFEAALVSVPTVASPTGPFRRAIEHGRTGLLAASADDWLDSLRRLVADPQLRREMAHAAYISSLAKFGPRQRALQMGRVIDQLQRGTRAARGFALDAYLSSRAWSPPAVYPSDIIFEGGIGGSASVSIIVPLYNYEVFVTEALDSAASQTLYELELVIVDGCSTDASLEVARSWAVRNAARFTRIAVLRNQANYGLALCRNSGFDAATAPYILPLDADNRLLNTCAAELLAAIQASGAAYVYPTLQQFGGSQGIHSGALYEPNRFVLGNYIDATALVAKEAWAIVGGYRHVQFGWEDYDFWSQLAEAGLAGEWLQKPLVEYRVHDSSITKKVAPSEQYSSLLSNFETRHPWVFLYDRHVKRNVPPLTISLKPHRSRLDWLISILRCPLTRQKLMYSEDGSELITVDGVRRWPIVEGRAALIPNMGAPEIKPADQISNEVPEAALAIIRETKGCVLNLSAGGSLEKFDHVVEVEFAVFRHTDILADAHYLPFDDECFDAVIAMNAFEHYRDPVAVAAELMRVLKPGGRLHIRTAFLQPLHEKPWHFFNCTRYGMAEWFQAFEHQSLSVSKNFCPNHSIAWLASDCEAALRADVSASAAEAFANASVQDLIELWRDPTKRNSALWEAFEKISQERQEITAAGFDLMARKPDRVSEGVTKFKTGT